MKIYIKVQNATIFQVDTIRNILDDATWFDVKDIHIAHKKGEIELSVCTENKKLVRHIDGVGMVRNETF